MINQDEVRAAIASLEKMKRWYSLRRLDMDISIWRVAAWTSVCIAGDCVMRHYGYRKAMLLQREHRKLFDRAAELFGFDMRRERYNLFFVNFWSESGREAYRLAQISHNRIGMIDAAIAETKRYLVPEPTQLEVNEVIKSMESRELVEA